MCYNVKKMCRKSSSIRRGAGGEASVTSVCRRPSVSSKLCAKRLSELCALCERKNSAKYASRPKGVTSHTTPLSIRRGAGGEASVTSVCRRRSVGSKCAPKGSVNSVGSVRERNTHSERKNYPRTVLAVK